MAGVFFALSLSCKAERLAGISGSDDRYFSAQAITAKGAHIVPNRRVIKFACLHFLNQSGGATCFPFNVMDNPEFWAGDFDAEVESGNPGT
jgi:hypothetical protein